MKKHLLDTNVFIQAKDTYYTFECFPGFWKWIDVHIKADQFFSVDKVLEELMERSDDLATWAKARKAAFLKSEEDGPTYESYKLLSPWVINNFTQAAQNKFFADADYSVVAYAHAHGLIVVTQEGDGFDSKNKVKIPNACREMGVRCITLFELIKEVSPKFHLP